MKTRAESAPHETRVARQQLIVQIGLGIMLAWITLAAIDVRGRGDDWRIFWRAGHYVGRPELLSQAHFVYMPGSAFVLTPFANLPESTAYFFYVALMVAAAVLSAWLAAKVYKLSFPLATLMALAWWPFTIAVCLGQNSPVALLLSMLTIFAISTDLDILGGGGRRCSPLQTAGCGPLHFAFLDMETMALDRRVAPIRLRLVFA